MQWYTIFVQTGNEERAAEEIKKCLSHSQYEELYTILILKLVTFERYSGGKIVKKERVMFPGYLLLNTDHIQELYELTLGCKNIIRFLKTENDFLTVKEHEIEPLLMLSNEDNVIGSSEIFIENESVRVFSGPLLNYTGKIYKIDRRKQRAKVAFELNGNQQLIDLPITILEKINLKESKNMIDFARKRQNVSC